MKKVKLLLYSLTLALILQSCTSNSNDPDFLDKVEGRYLYTEDETVKVYSKDNTLLLN